MIPHFIEIERISQNEDIIEGVPKKWESHTKAISTIRPMKGSEVAESGRMEGRQPIEVKSHYTEKLAAVTTDMRVRVGSSGSKRRTLEIQSVENVNERNRTIILVCLETN